MINYTITNNNIRLSLLSFSLHILSYTQSYMSVFHVPFLCVSWVMLTASIVGTEHKVACYWWLAEGDVLYEHITSSH